MIKIDYEIFPNELTVHKKIITGLVCILLINMLLLNLVPLDFANAKISNPAILGSRANADEEPNNNFDTASQINPKYDFVNITDILGNFSSGDTIDCYSFWASKGDANGKNADRMFFWLHDINTASGVYMELYAPKPYTHRLAISEVHDVSDPKTNPGHFDMVAPLNGTYFIKVISISPNPGSLDGYVLRFYYIKEPYNSGYPPGDNSFEFAKRIDFTKENKSLSNVYLDPIWDIHDFYNFTGYKNQTIEIILHVNSTADYDLFLFDNKSIIPFKNSTNIGYGTDENINATLTENKFYYVRVWAKVNGSIKPPNNYGRYSLEFKGNIPPILKNGTKDYFVENEDGPPIFIEPEDIWEDLNINDTLEYLLWNDLSEDWEPRKNNDMIISTINYNILKVQIINNGTIPSHDEVIKIIPIKDKFGIVKIKLGARDLPAGCYCDFFITIELKPVNDPPILNGTDLWENGNFVNPNNNGTMLTGFEGLQFETHVTAYDPVETLDSITFYDNTDLFDIDPTSGSISFLPTYKNFGNHIIEISARDNGSYPNETKREFIFNISYDTKIQPPKVKLLNPEFNTIQYNLTPIFEWELINKEIFQIPITYELYLSTDKDLVEGWDINALVATLEDITIYTPSKQLIDQEQYYWAVKPNDGLHTGECISGVFSFLTDTKIPIPIAILKTPYDNQMLETTTVTLTWELNYSGSDQVKYDLYFSDNLEDILNQTCPPQKENLIKTYFTISGLYINQYYYWQVIPWTNSVRSDFYKNEIRKFYITEHIPRINLLSPYNRTIQYNNWVQLIWEINYNEPETVESELYFKRSRDTYYQKINANRNNSYNLFDLEEDTYYWKVVPFIQNNLRGIDSELWQFTIIKDLNLPRTRLISPVNITIFSEIVEFEWEIILSESGDISTFWYDLYIDNVTDDPYEMTLIKSKYENTNYQLELPIESKKVYYWYVIPHADTKDSHLKGYCSSGVVYFEFDYKKPKYNISLKLENSTLKIKPGMNRIVNFTIENIGNRETLVNISILIESIEKFNLTFNTRNTWLQLNDIKRMNFTIFASTDIEIKNYLLTIIAYCLEDTSVMVEESLIIEIYSNITNGKNNDTNVPSDPNGSTGPSDPNGSNVPSSPNGSNVTNDELDDDHEHSAQLLNNFYILLSVSIFFIIIILILLFVYIKFNPNRFAKQNDETMIYSYIKEHPGDHYLNIQKAFKLDSTEIINHLQKLEQAKLIKSQHDGKLQRFYPIETNIQYKQ